MRMSLFSWTWGALTLLLASAAAQATDAPQTEGIEVVELTEKDLVEQDDYEVKLSLPTEEDFLAWKSTGFRLQLGYGYGQTLGFAPAPRFTGHSILLRPSVRLDKYWSLAGTFQYTIASGGITGLRWSATFEPVFHPVGGLAIAFGVGYGGMAGDRPYDAANEPLEPGRQPGRTIIVKEDSGGFSQGSETHSRTADPQERLQNCSGNGWSALARVEYLLVVGSLFATGPFVQGDLQATRCAQVLAQSKDNETGESTKIRRWWGHRCWSVGWWAAWR